MALGVVGIAHVDAHHQRRLVLLGPALQQVGLALGHLDRVRLRGHERVDHAGHILQSDEEARFVADSVVDGNVEAAPVGEEPVHP